MGNQSMNGSVIPTNQKKKVKNRIESVTQYFLFFITSMFLATQANASAFTKLTTLFTAWKTEFYILLAAGAFLYVMWDIVKVFSKKLSGAMSVNH
ncbi:hypothetical protein ACN08N_25925 (plasmid) [Photobacterium leiognathi subsp. mandapamensis]|uniref:hypothetical protein n=1 Tax=Photobacterium leiognathi TaxID=553611 RepID=UPI003AF36396